MSTGVVIWVVTGVIVATAIGNRAKGRALLGLLLGWIGVIIIAFMPPTREKLVQRERERLEIEHEAQTPQP